MDLIRNFKFTFGRIIPVLILSGVLFDPQPACAQSEGGDQFLDGIGETALVARYVLNGNTTDRSRNNHQAVLQGSGGTYVEDDSLGKCYRYLELVIRSSRFQERHSKARKLSVSQAGCVCVQPNHGSDSLTSA